MTKIDVIIPVKNEEGTLGGVITWLKMHENIGTIIVGIDSHNTDNSRAIACEFSGVQVIMCSRHGKGEVVTECAQFAHGGDVILCDADYRISPKADKQSLYNYLDWLVNANGKMRVGIPTAVGKWPAGFDTTSALLSYPYMSGLRSVPRFMLRKMELIGYLMETQLNHFAMAENVHVEFEYMREILAPLRFTQERLDDLRKYFIIGEQEGIL